MSERKVISLAEQRARRADPLGIQWRERWDAPVNRDRYDAWVETDGSFVMRIDANAAVFQKARAEYGRTDGPTVFAARGNAYEVRIPAEQAAEWFKDMQAFAICSRRTVDTRRGVYSWRFTANGDGTYQAKYEHRRATFVAFKPRARKTDGPVISMGPFGPVRGKPVMAAPSCAACSRIIQIGEAAYREQRNPSGRAWPDAVICETCIKRAPGEGLRDAKEGA